MIEKKMTTKEVAESLGCTVKTVMNNAVKCLPNKVFENGKPTETSLGINDFKYSKEDICNMCNVSARTFDNFIALQPMAKRDFISTGSSHKKFYNEEAKEVLANLVAEY